MLVILIRASCTCFCGAENATQDGVRILNLFLIEEKGLKKRILFQNSTKILLVNILFRQGM